MRCPRGKKEIRRGSLEQEKKTKVKAVSRISLIGSQKARKESFFRSQDLEMENKEDGLIESKVRINRR